MDKGIKPGDIVIKALGNDAGLKGMVLEVETNSLNNSFVTVMLLGEMVEKLWYVNLVEIVYDKEN